jgi:RNA polymerase sigma factor (sigma-70 family)
MRTVPDSSTDPTIADLLELALPERSQQILRYGLQDLEPALKLLAEQEFSPQESLTCERVAWAIAHHLEQVFAGNAPIARSLSRRIPRDTPWYVFWGYFRRPIEASQAGPKSLPLTELAKSLACEQREDWQPSAIDKAEAKRALQIVCSANNEAAVRLFAARFGRNTGSPEDIVAEAWGRLYVSHWSPEATKRLVLATRISVFVYKVAANIAKDVIRERKRTQPSNELEADVATLALGDNPGKHQLSKEAHDAIEQCKKGLTGRQRIVVLMREGGMKRREIAERLHTSAPNITQILQAAEKRMKSCLQERGFGHLEFGSKGS